MYSPFSQHKHLAESLQGIIQVVESNLNLEDQWILKNDSTGVG